MASYELARRNPAFFNEQVLTDNNGNYIINGEIHLRWHEHVNNNSKVLIESPREHGKTEQMVIGRALWELGRNPNLKIKIISASDPLASQRVLAIGEHIKQNERLKYIYPDLKHAPGKTWTGHQLFVKRDIISKDPSIEGYGVLSSATGGRADLIIYDDIVDLRNSMTQPKLRESVKEAFYNVWANLLSPDGRMIYIFTPWHQDDLSHDLKRNPEYKILSILINSDCDTIWPEHWSKEALQQRKREIGNRAFARGFEGIAMSDEEAIFRNIVNCIDRNYRIYDVMNNRSWHRYGGLDLAISQKTTADYTVLHSLAIDGNRRRFPFDIQRGRFTSVQTARIVRDTFDRFEHQLIKVENNAYQQAFLEWLGMLEGTCSMPVEPYTTGKQKFDESIGLPSLAAEIDRSDWIIPMGDGDHPSDCNCNFCIWINEMMNYPVASHDDTVMSSFFAREAAMNRNMPGMLV